MSYLLHPQEENMFSELKEAGYHVWMNARNDLLAGQVEGWIEANADEIFYGGDVPAAPEPEKSHGGHAEDLYSHYEGRLKLDSQERNYTSDDEAVDAAIGRAISWKEDKPLCMFLGLMYPHVPYQVEEPYFSAIDREKLPERIRIEECTGKSKMIQLIHEYQKLEGFSEEQWDELRATYLGMCMKVDEQFRRLCDGLKRAGIYEDCAIFVLSDHGDFAGDYGVTEKAQSSFEDCLTRVPLLIKPPIWEKADPGITDAMTELVDFYATVMDYAGVTPQRTHFGKSLRPVIEDRNKQNRTYVFSEGGRLPEELHCDEFHAAGPEGPSEKFVYYPKMKAQTDNEAHIKATMIRDKKYKYISRISGEDEFYDMEADPSEKINQISNPEYALQIAKMQVEMMKWYQRTCDVVPYTYDKRFSDEMMWAKVKNLCPPGYEEDVKAKIRGNMKQGALYMYLHEISGGTSC